MILNLLRGGRVSEEELICEIGDPLDKFLERNIFLVWREEADAQAANGRWVRSLGIDLR